jgi:hypothetical protein
MRDSMKRTASRVALALGLGSGCRGNDQAAAANPAPPTYGVVSASINADLSRLESLEIFAAPRLVYELPAEATACYGQPCAPNLEPAFRAEQARQAPRLAHLADLAAAVARDKSLTPAPSDEAAAALSALIGLRIVATDGLLRTTATSSPSCYNLPCPSDVEAAERTNGLRVARPAAIAAAAKSEEL